MARELLEELLQRASARHDHLCPRQVLGVRMGMYAATLLDLPLPQTDKRVLTLIETDGCFADGVAVASGCEIGHRTLRLVDYGKVAATFIDTQTGRAVRIAPTLDSRDLAAQYAGETSSRWRSYLEAYQVMPDDALFMAQEVSLNFSVESVVSKHGPRVNCAHCGEEIINEREVVADGEILCRACAGDSYCTAQHDVTTGTTLNDTLLGIPHRDF